MDLSIIIVNYNSRDKTFVCIESILRDVLLKIEYEIIIVDNDSEEEISEQIKIKYPQIIFIKSNKNLGMGGGNNLGAKLAKGDYILILNPDTITSSGAIANLFEYVKGDKRVGLAGPKLLNRDLTIQYSCRRFPTIMTPFFRRTALRIFGRRHNDKYLMRDFDHNSVKEVNWMLGACFIVESDLFKNILNGFDDKNFFMYFEDVDLCRRIWEGGYRVIYFPMAEIIHDHAQASSNNNWFTSLFTNRLAREHIKSWINYLCKWR